MRIAFLAAATIHSVRWVNALAERGHEVHLITMHAGKENLDKRIILHKLKFSAPIGYYLNVIALKNILKKIKPDLLNTHYASGYGTLARLSGFSPYLLSVWGSDVYLFPYHSKWNFSTLVKNLKAADKIASTSEAMKLQTESLYQPNKEIAITPFGVDCDKFQPDPQRVSKKLRIGTIKTMSQTYGISYLMEAFAIARDHGLQDAELILVGDGHQMGELKELAQKLRIEDSVQFIGAIPHDEVPKWLNTFDIFIALSNSESFGVAIIEASACAVPVIVSNVGGLPEVVVQGETGYIVPPRNPQAAAESIIELASNHQLRQKMGDKGRQFVLKNYEWEENVDRMELLYQDVLKEYRN